MAAAGVAIITEAATTNTNTGAPYGINDASAGLSGVDVEENRGEVHPDRGAGARRGRVAPRGPISLPWGF
jgi:hypothetical protein